MRPIVRVAGGIAVTLMAVGTGMYACGGGDADGEATRGVDAGYAADGGVSDARVSDSGVIDAAFEGYPCVPARPSWVPASWQVMTDWYCDCPIYYSVDGVDVPPFQWTPCDLSTLPDGGAGLACEQLSVPVPGNVIAIGPIIADSTRPGRFGVGVIAQTGSVGHTRPWLVVGTADGPMEFAATTPGETYACGLYSGGMSILNGTFVAPIEGHLSATKPVGIVERDTDGSLRVIHRGTKDTGYGAHGGYGLVYVGKTPGLATYLITDAGGLQQIDPIPGQGDGLTGGTALPFAGGTFLQRYSGMLRAIDTWTVAGGHKPFLHAPNPWQKGYGSFGTDGKDIVWSEGSGPPPAGGDPDTFSVRELYTSPYTTDPAKLVPRHLRSEPDQYQGRSAVGCGYMVKGFDAAQQHPAIVVRLSDGRAWLIPSSVPGTPPLSSVSFASAPATYGVTCDHIYIEAAVGAYLTVFRFRIDSLGPGYPVGEDPPGW